MGNPGPKAIPITKRSSALKQTATRRDATRTVSSSEKGEYIASQYKPTKEITEKPKPEKTIE